MVMTMASQTGQEGNSADGWSTSEGVYISSHKDSGHWTSYMCVLLCVYV